MSGGRKSEPEGVASGSARELSDDALLELVQRRTFDYFWAFGHPLSGLARDRTNSSRMEGDDVVTTGGSGFAAMAIVVATERGWVARPAAVAHLLRMTRFLRRADRYHGVFPHFLNGATGTVIPFTARDDGADLVETSFLIAGLLCARQYFGRDDADEAELRRLIDELWRGVDWTWHTRAGGRLLYWHWSPTHGWAMDLAIRGWNECLLTYLLAAASPSHAIDPGVYHAGWAGGPHFLNGRTYYDVELLLGPDYGGPLFFAHYSFLGLDPRGLRDRYADYWRQNVNHVLINREHCVRNPNGFRGYGEACWGLTASDSIAGYRVHCPTDDLGVITPTAAIASMPYAPDHCLRALRHFHHDLGDRLWGPYGFFDAFSSTEDWVAPSHIAIDQGPIVIMIENHRSGLIWDLFMSCDEIRTGLSALGFDSPHLTDARIASS